MSEKFLAINNSFKNIKSIYFVKFIFSYLNEKSKLEIIKYNKHLQNILDIKFINYKFMSCSYIIYETNGKGKEYLGWDDYLLFEGEYLNGKRNGKGKEYLDYLRFEGKYLNGLRWNGKGYDIQNNVVYELKNGKGYVK